MRLFLAPFMRRIGFLLQPSRSTIEVRALWAIVLRSAAGDRFLPEKAAELNIPPGPWRRELVAGKRVILPDSRIIEPDQVLGESRKGTSLVVVGDTGRTDNLLKHVEGADALVIESTYTEAERELADRFDHLTAAQAASFAKEAGVSQLFLTHLSRRYRERDVLEEAQVIFPAVHVARDFDSFQIKRENE